MKRITILCSALFFLFVTGTKAQTVFSDNFNAGAISANWVGNGAYGLTQSGGILAVKVSNVTINSSFYVDLGGNINITSNPVLNLKLKTKNVCILKVTLSAADGTSAYKEVRIASAIDSFVNYCFDYSASTFTKSTVNKITFAVNDFANTFSGTLCFEDLILGTGAVKLAGICPLRDVTVYEGKTGQKILVTDISNANSITVSGAGALMTGISYSALTTTASMGKTGTITYTAGTPGSAWITVTSVATVGYSNNTSKFKLTVEANNAPAVDQAANTEMAVGKDQYVTLTGISDGNTSVEQNITITAVSSATGIIPNPAVTYSNGASTAVLKINPAAAGSAVITVTVQDDGTVNNSKTMIFTVNSFTNFNYTPTVNIPAAQSAYITAGSIKVKLTGISDGNGGTQNLTIVGTGKYPAVISAFNTSFTQGRDTAVLTLTAAGLGKDTITVTVTDNGDNGTNNGNKSVQVSFPVAILPAPPTGYKIVMNDFTADTTAKLWKIEGLGVTQFCKYVDTLGAKWIRININQKMNWTGIWYNLPLEIDVSNAPYMSYKIMGSGFTPLLTHAYFWDVDYTRNTQGAHKQRDTITLSPQDVFLDFRDPLDQINDKGVPMNMSRVVQILFNYHNKFQWPNNLVSGVVYISDFRMGDSCKNVPAVMPVCTIDPVPTIVTWAGAGQQTIKLTGISNGKGNTTGVSVTAVSLKPTFIADPVKGTLGSDGSLTLTYTPGATVNSARITVTVSAAGSTSKDFSFYIFTASDAEADITDISIDASKKTQTIVGFGGHHPPEYLLEKYANEQGCTYMRTSIDWGFELSNDNTDPSILNRSGFNKTIVDFDYYRKAYEAGVTDIFVTLWAPPAWMMQSLSSVRVEGAPDWNVTTQKVDPLYYDEYIEYMVTIVRMIKEEAGVEIAAFCPQNEPAFTEPYGSAILDPAHMAEICGKLGKRLHDEGFSTKTITSEQVFSQNHYSVVEYATAAKADVLANQYCQIVGNHYPGTNLALWQNQFAACTTGTTYPKELWSTECHTDGNSFAAVMAQMEIMIQGFNRGCAAWNVWGYNQGTSGHENDMTKVAGMTFGYGTSKHFWAFKNWAKYVRKGAVQIKSTVTGNANVLSAAFYHEQDSTLTYVVINKDGSNPKSIKISGTAPAAGYTVYRTSFYEKCVAVNEEKNGLYILPPQSISTFVQKTGVKNSAPRIDQASSKYILSGSMTTTLTGINCGDPIQQNLTVTAVSNNTAIIATPEITYTSPNTTCSIKITALAGQSGTAVITVTVKDDGGTANGGVDQTTMSFNVTTGTTALKDVSGKTSLFPNPASDVVTITVPSELLNAKLILNNVSGAAISEQIVTGDNTAINVADLPAGMYMITISNETSIAKMKFAKK